MLTKFSAATIFKDHMVLQRDKEITVFGVGLSEETVTVTLAEHKAETVGKEGSWQVSLPAMPAGGPYELRLESNQGVITYQDVMIGDVWLAGGQSNMEFALKENSNYEEELLNLTPEIMSKLRFFNVPRQSSIEENNYEETLAAQQWQPCDKEVCKSWSAVGYFFAKRLLQNIDVTIGIVGCNWGATSATAWISKKTLNEDSLLKEYVDDYNNVYQEDKHQDYLDAIKDYEQWGVKWELETKEIWGEHPEYSWEDVVRAASPSRWPGPMGPKSWQRPGGLYETMLTKICPYTLKGIIYYQAESDDHKPQLYARLMTCLINSLRADWSDDKLPFLFVQLPFFMRKDEADTKNWAILREQQMTVHKDIPNTGIAVCLDLGEFDNIHPRDKRNVGERLALQALLHVYGEQVEAYGPIFEHCILKDNEIEVVVSHLVGEMTLVGNAMDCFEIAGEDQQFVPAKVVLAKNRILVSSEQISVPRYVRYNYKNYGESFVFGGNSIPLAPFLAEVSY